MRKQTKRAVRSTGTISFGFAPAHHMIIVTRLAEKGPPVARERGNGAAVSALVCGVSIAVFRAVFQSNPKGLCGAFTAQNVLFLCSLLGIVCNFAVLKSSKKEYVTAVTLEYIALVDGELLKSAEIWISFSDNSSCFFKPLLLCRSDG